MYVVNRGIADSGLIWFDSKHSEANTNGNISTRIFTNDSSVPMFASNLINSFSIPGFLYIMYMDDVIYVKSCVTGD